MSFSRLAKGTYYVVVDGASGSDKGTYKLDVSATCDGIDDLRIVELGIGATDYAVIRNMSDCLSSVAHGWSWETALGLPGAWQVRQSSRLVTA